MGMSHYLPWYLAVMEKVAPSPWHFKCHYEEVSHNLQSEWRFAMQLLEKSLRLKFALRGKWLENVPSESRLEIGGDEVGVCVEKGTL